MLRDNFNKIHARPDDENYKTLLREIVEDLNKRRAWIKEEANDIQG